MKAHLFDRHGVDIHTPISETWQIRAYESDLIERVHDYCQMLDAPVLVDVGASSGSFTLLAAFHPGMTVHAFEPCIPNRLALIANLWRNGVGQRVTVHGEALGAEQTTGLLNIPTDVNINLATVGVPERFERYAQQPVQIVPLDDRIQYADVLKIDAEGSELPILKGATGLITRCYPLIVIECSAINTRQMDYEPDKIMNWLREAGYTWKTLGANLWCWHTDMQRAIFNCLIHGGSIWREDLSLYVLWPGAIESEDLNPEIINAMHQDGYLRIWENNYLLTDKGHDEFEWLQDTNIVWQREGNK